MRAGGLVVLFALVRAIPGYAGESAEYLFRLHCSGCHGFDGAGTKTGRVPQFESIVGHFAASDNGRLYLVHVPGVANAALPDAETAKVLNYVLHRWTVSDSQISPRDFSEEEVHILRDVHVDDISALRTNIEAALARIGTSIAY